jgi:LacI family transcriptional regulator
MVRAFGGTGVWVQAFGKRAFAHMTTLKDLSKVLGLSVTQVSRALNGHSDVNEATRLRVMDAAKSLNYHPNISARKLATGRSGIVGLVIPAMHDRAGDHLFVQQIRGLSERFSQNNVRFILHMADPEEDLIDAYRRLIDSASLDGFVLTDARDFDPRITFLKMRGVPFVLHGRSKDTVDHPFYDIDNFAVGYQLTQHLLTGGHRRIAVLNGKEGRSYCTQRQRGYVQALSESGIDYDPSLHRNGHMEHGFGLVETVLLMKMRVPPTAVIAGNTLIAKGIYDALAALNLSVPKDVSVVAHDDVLPLAATEQFSPPLTVTVSPLHASWSPLADILLGALNGQNIETLQKIGEIGFECRASVAPPR